MTTCTVEEVYKDRDNSNDFILSQEKDGVTTPSDLSGVTKMLLEFKDGTTVSSDDISGMFDWLSPTTTGQVNIKMGLAPNIEVNTKYYPNLIVYDGDNTRGVNWGEIESYVE